MANELLAIDTSSETVYCILAAWGGANSGYVWSSGSLTPLTYAGWATAAIPMPSIGNGTVPGTTNYAANFPATGIANYWLARTYKQLGASPAPNDPLTTDNSNNQLVFQTNSSGAIIPLFGGASQLFAPSVFNLPADMYNEFGKNNIEQWSALDGSKTENFSRELFNTLRSAQMIRSFFSTGNGNILSSAPDMPTVNRWAASFAGCFLFAARGAEQDPRMTTGLFGGGAAKLSTLSFGRFEGKYDYCQREMGEYRAGMRQPAGQSKAATYYGSSDPPIFPNGIIAGGPWGI